MCLPMDLLYGLKNDVKETRHAEAEYSSFSTPPTLLLYQGYTLLLFAFFFLIKPILFFEKASLLGTVVVRLHCQGHQT